MMKKRLPLEVVIRYVLVSLSVSPEEVVSESVLPLLLRLVIVLVVEVFRKVWFVIGRFRRETVVVVLSWS